MGNQYGGTHVKFFNYLGFLKPDFSVFLAFIILKKASIDRFHCHATKNEIGNRPVEETKKMKCYRRLIYKQFVQV